MLRENYAINTEFCTFMVLLEQLPNRILTRSGLDLFGACFPITPKADPERDQNKS